MYYMYYKLLLYLLFIILRPDILLISVKWCQDSCLVVHCSGTGLFLVRFLSHWHNSYYVYSKHLQYKKMWLFLCVCLFVLVERNFQDNLADLKT